MGERWHHLRAYNLDRAQASELKPTQQTLFEEFGFPAIPPPLGYQPSQPAA